MISFFTGMPFIDILACIVGTIAFVVAVVCIVKIHYISNGGKWSGE